MCNTVDEATEWLLQKPPVLSFCVYVFLTDALYINDADVYCVW
jgi:hypothetical protein